MKRLLFSLVALMAVMAIQAQSICGSWQLMQPKVTNEGDGHVIISYIHTFNEDGTFYSDADVTLSSKPAKTKEKEIAVSGTIKGTYTLEGDQLKMFVNVNTFNLELVSMSENGKVLDIDNPDLRSRINGVLTKEGKAKMAESLVDDSYTIKVTANGQMLELTDTKDGEVERLMRIATVKH